MPRRYFNWKLLIVLIIGFVVLCITAYGLRQWQRSRRAEQGLVLGNKAYNEHKWEDAATNLGRYISVVGDDVPVLLKYAESQLNIRPTKRNNIQQAVAAYRNILRIDKNNSEAAVRLTEVYLQMNMPGEAELIATRTLETNKVPKLQRMLAIAFANQRKFKEAAKELENIIKEHPKEILAYEILGQLIEQRREIFSETPEFWFNEAVKNNPAEAEAYIIRGAYHLRHSDKIKAMSDLTEAEQKDLSNSVTRLRLAREFINLDALDKARKHLEIVQAAEPTNQLLWQTQAVLALKSSSKAKMTEIAQAGLKELASQPWDFMPVAAELFIQSGQYDLAADCINQLRQKDIAPATTAFLDGSLADAKGHGYEAVKCWYQAMQLGAESARVRLALASTLSRLGDKQSAIRQLRTLISQQPNLVGGRLNLARLLTETGNWAEAVEQARAVMQTSPDNLESILLYVQAKMQLLAQSQTSKDSPMWQDIEGRLDTLRKNSEDALSVKLLQIQLAVQRSRFNDAQLLLDEVKNRYPSRMEVIMAESDLLTVQGKTDEAILKLYDAVRTSPQSVIPVRNLTVLLAVKDRRQECETAIKDALTRITQPADKSQLGLLLANLYDRWNEQGKRCQLLDSLASDFPEDILLKRELLRCEKVIKDLNYAQQLVDKIKNIEGEKGWQWRYEQAKIWFIQDNFKEWYPQIISLLKENLLANPDDQTSRMLVAAVYERAGELQLAVSTYREALDRSPADIRIIVPTVAALYKTNDYEHADEILRRAANEKLSNPELEKLELQGHLRRGELSSAGNILEDMLASDPNNQSVSLILAMLKMKQNKFAEADELLGKLMIKDPNSLSVKVAQVELNVLQKKSAEALLLCDEIINKFNSASAYILRGRTYSILKQTDKATADFENATAIEPNNAQAWMARSNFYRSIGRIDEAAAAVQQALSLAPDNVQIKKLVIALFLTSDNPDRVKYGKTTLDETLTAHPEDIELRLYKARILLVEGTAPGIGQAEEILQKITEDQPKFSDAWAMLAEIALKQGQSAKAIDIVLRGLVANPNNRSLLLLKARSEAMSSPALAIPTLEALRELDPNDTDVTVYLADKYIAAHKYEEAVNLLKTQLASQKDTPYKRKINVALAIALHKNGNKAEAQTQFESLIQSDPNDPVPLLAQAGLLKDDQLWDQLSRKVLDWYQSHPKDFSTPVIIAKDLADSQNNQAKETSEGILRVVIEKDTNCTEAMGVLAMLLQMTGRPAESAALYQKIITLQPDNIIAINNLAWIMCENNGKYQQALELAQRGIEKTPNYIDLIDTRGVIYYRLGDFDKAVQDFTRCIKLYPAETPSVVASYFHLGRALAKLEQKDKAVENLKEALQQNTKIGGLSAADLDEVKRLLEDLSKGKGEKQ